MHTAARGLRQKLADRKTVLGTMLVEYSGPATVGVFADAGFDFLVLDCEHGNFDARAIEATIEAAHHAAIAILMRPADIARSPITWAMDAGCAGVLIPAVDTLDEVRRVVRFTKYRPLGRRGVHLFRAHTRHRNLDPVQFMAEANEQTLTMVQIETAASVKLVDEIAATPGVDGLYLGPGDLSVDLGVAGQWEAPVVQDAMRQVTDACQKHNKIAACHANQVEAMLLLRAIGFSMFGCNCDIGLMKDRADALGAAFQAQFGRP